MCQSCNAIKEIGKFITYYKQCKQCIKKKCNRQNATKIIVLPKSYRLCDSTKLNLLLKMNDIISEGNKCVYKYMMF